MKRKIPIAVDLLAEMMGLADLLGWPNLDVWLSRALPRAQVAALSPDAKKARRRAIVRISQRKGRAAKAFLAPNR
jgi:hypothetical protein